MAPAGEVDGTDPGASAERKRTDARSGIPLGRAYQRVHIGARNHSQIFIHKSWAMVMGNSDDMTKAVAMLNTTDEQIADIYASKTGRGREAMMKLMTDETLLTGQTALELGLVDKLIDGNPVHNFTEVEIQNMKGKLAAMNSLKLSAPTQGADQQQKQQEKIMETENKALLTEQVAQDSNLIY
jgi:ATP-dependent Clp protease protease subunit